MSKIIIIIIYIKKTIIIYIHIFAYYIFKNLIKRGLAIIHVAGTRDVNDDDYDDDGQSLKLEIFLVSRACRYAWQSGSEFMK